MNEITLDSPSVNFLEANTNAITLEELAEQCVVPTWANQELTISHQDFSHEGWKSPVRVTPEAQCR